jgi:gas vesicle protein GvpA/GvpJ/GvpM family
MRTDLQPMNGRASGLVDVLDRVLDKGLVVAGDIKISLAEVELLTIRIRLIVCSIDKAEQIGLDWWRYDGHLAPGRDRLAVENASLKKQIRSLERRVAALAAPSRARGPADRVRGRQQFPGRSNDAR